MKKIIAGGLAGGLVLFIWSSIYWAASGIPIAPMKVFKDEAAVEAVLRNNSSGPGYYVLPTPHVDAGGDAEAAERATKRMEKVATNFFFAGAVQPGGIGSLGGQLGMSFLGNVMAAALATCLLCMARLESYWMRVMFTMGLGFLSGLMCRFPDLVWWGFPADYVARQFFDLLVGSTLAGLVLAWIGRHSGIPGVGAECTAAQLLAAYEPRALPRSTVVWSGSLAE